MITEINLPDIGLDKAEVTEILVKIGDKVKVDQTLITIEGDKVLMEIPSPKEGIIKEIKIKVGDKITPNELIMLCEEDLKTITSFKEVFITDKNLDNLKIIQVLVKIGDNIEINQLIMIAKNNNDFLNILAPFSGIVKDIKIGVGDKINIYRPIIILEVKNYSSSLDLNKKVFLNVKDMISSNIKDNTNVLPTDDNNKNYYQAHGTPVIRRLAREFNINLNKIKGTGRKNRILYEDIQAYIQKSIKHYECNNFTDNDSQEVTPHFDIDFSKFGNVKEVKLSKIQITVGTKLYHNWIKIPHVTQFDEVDITEIEMFRKKQNCEAKENKLDVNITILSFVMKVIAQALKEMPYFNSSLSTDAKKLIIKNYININIAMDTPNGLVVPVFRNVNNKGIIELAIELTKISKKARSGNLNLADMQGGCFTISNLGNIGGTAFTPIINAPEVAILGISKSYIKPIWNGKDFLPRLMLPLALSYDHRVINGVDGACFLNFIKKVLSDIRCLVM